MMRPIARAVLASVVLCPAAATARADEWSVTTADFRTAPAVLRGLSAEGVRVSAPDGTGDRTVPLTDFVSAQRAGPAAVATAGRFTLVLSDGDRLVGEPTGVAGEDLAWAEPLVTANAQPTARTLWDFTDFTLAASATVEFRFFEYGATAINSGSTVSAAGTTRIANVTTPSAPVYDLIVNGPNAAVEPLNPAAAPEPSALAIAAAAVGLLGLVIYRRNQAA